MRFDKKTFVPTQIETKMATTTFDQTITTTYANSRTNRSVFAKFFYWCNAQQHNRLLWLGVILAAHGCILTPLTSMAVLYSGNSLLLFMLSIIAMSLALVTNLAAMPTKYTLPAFFLSIFIDLGIVIACAVSSFA